MTTKGKGKKLSLNRSFIRKEEVKGKEEVQKTETSKLRDYMHNDEKNGRLAKPNRYDHMSDAFCFPLPPFLILS